MTNTGIYVWINIVNGKRYVGSSLSISRRKSGHISYLKRNKHHNSHLQGAWNKYGEDSFIFEVLQYCNKEQLLENEQYWIDYFQSYKRDLGYNSHPFAGRSIGAKHSEETKKKLSEIMKGKYDGEKHPHFGKPLSEETKKRISEAKKGKLGKEFHIKMSEIQRGENNSCAKLTWEKVGEIRRMWKTKEYTQFQLAKIFDISRGAINNVVNNYQWKQERK